MGGVVLRWDRTRARSRSWAVDLAVVRDVFRDDRTGTDGCVTPDADAWEDDGTCANGREVVDDGRFGCVGGIVDNGIAIVGEGDIRADKDVLSDLRIRREKGMRTDAGTKTDDGGTTDFNEGANGDVVANDDVGEDDCEVPDLRVFPETDGWVDVISNSHRCRA